MALIGLSWLYSRCALIETGTPADPNFSGGDQRRDGENGLDWYYFGARYYNPAIGRWMVVDPMADKYPSWSQYLYVFDNPLRLADPTGMAPDEPYKDDPVRSISEAPKRLNDIANRQLKDCQDF